MNDLKIETDITYGDVRFSEDKVMEHFAQSPERFPNYTRLEGIVTFVNGDKRVEMEDSLFYLLPTLAFETVPELTETGQTELELYASPERFTLSSDGTVITMKSLSIPEPLAFTQEALITETLAACRRFLTWSEKIWPDQDLELPMAKKTLERIAGELIPTSNGQDS